MEIENLDKQEGSFQVPQEGQPFLRRISRRKDISIIVLSVVLIIIFVGMGTRKKQGLESPPLTNQITSSTYETTKLIIDDFFLFSTPKPIKDLTVYQLPNDLNPHNVVQYKDSLWFVGGGSLFEYDVKSRKLISYSDPTKTNCDTNVVVISNYLYTPCHTDNINDAFGHTEQLTTKVFTGHYSVFKINPSTHQVEYIFTDKDGLQNRYNFYLYADGNNVWIATFGGIGRIDTVANQVEFYANELGIRGSTFSVNKMLVDEDYVWAAVGANVESHGGLTMYNKKRQTWVGFNTIDLKDYSTDRFDLEKFKLVPGGIQIAFRDGEMGGDVDRLVEKQYIYQTEKWIKVNSEKPASGRLSDSTFQYLETSYPATPKQATTDQYGLTQLILPETKQTFKLDGRDSYILLPMVDNKRYILTSATVDIIDDILPFQQILVKLGPLPSAGERGEFSYGGSVNFLVDHENSLAVITDSDCGGIGCSGKQKIWFIDLKSAKINRVYTKNDGINDELLGGSTGGLSMRRTGGLLVIIDESGKSIFNIDTTTNKLTVLKK